jgi:hypothetical protein
LCKKLDVVAIDNIIGVDNDDFAVQQHTEDETVSETLMEKMGNLAGNDMTPEGEEDKWQN